MHIDNIKKFCISSKDFFIHAEDIILNKKSSKFVIEPARKNFIMHGKESIMMNGIPYSEHISDLISGTWVTDYRQKSSNFCHFATPLLGILDNPETRTVFLAKILPQKITNLGEGNYKIKLAEGKAYTVNQSELNHAKIEGTKGLKLLANAYEKYLMNAFPSRYKDNNGQYIDTIGNINTFFCGIFNKTTHLFYNNLPNNIKVDDGFSELLKQNGTYNPKDYLLFASSKRGAPNNKIISTHYYFIKYIDNKEVRLTQPFNPNEDIILTHKEFYDNFASLNGILKSDITSG